MKIAKKQIKFIAWMNRLAKTLKAEAEVIEIVINEEEFEGTADVEISFGPTHRLDFTFAGSFSESEDKAWSLSYDDHEGIKVSIDKKNCEDLEAWTSMRRALGI